MGRASFKGGNTSSKEVPPNAAPVALFSGSAEVPAWRLIHLGSDSNLPFEVQITWDGEPFPLRVTVPLATFVCVWAKELRIDVTTQTLVPNKVSVRVDDASMVTENVWESRSNGAVLAHSFVVGRHARAVRVECDDVSLYAGMVITLTDQAGTVLGEVAGNTQPPGGIPLGTAVSVDVTVGAPSNLRAILYLNL